MYIITLYNNQKERHKNILTDQLKQDNNIICNVPVTSVAF